MRNRIVKIAWMLALGLPTVAMAQQRPEVPRGEGTWEFNGSVGLKIQDRALSGFLASGSATTRFTDTDTPGRIMPAGVLRLGYNFDRNWGFSLGTELATGSGVKYVTPFWAVTWTKDLNAKTSPFVTLANQFTRIVGSNGRLDHATIGVSLGLGVRRMISENVALRVEGRMALEHYQDLPGAKSAYPSMITIGLSYFTGGQRPVTVAARAAPCPVCALGRARVDTIIRARVDTLRMARVDTVRIRIPVPEPQPDQLVLRVQFQTDSTILLPRSRPVLDTIAQAIIATPNSRWEVQGHTDNVGTTEHNRTLAQGRAQTVVDYLVRRGVDRSILTAVGFGSDRPVFSNSTVYGRAQNRRVQLRRVPPPPTGAVVP